ncbi:alpha-2-macroglobulin family protein [Vibrio sp. PP-XX7]
MQAEIEHAPKLRPLAGAAIVVRLDQPVKQPTWVTLSLVDKGIINLSRYKVPNMYHWFFDQRRYNGDVIDLYSRIYQQRPDSFLTHRYGGDTQANTNSHLDDTVESKTITLMSAPVAFNQQGEAVIHVDIPDYNGQAQIVAMVFNDHQYGQATSDVDIASPVVAELAVPRFLNPGDTSQTVLELFNQTKVEQQITVKVSASELLSLHHPGEFTFSLAPGKRVSRAGLDAILSWPCDTTSAPATLNIDLSAVGSDGSRFDQHRNWHIPVRVTQPIVTRQTLQTIPAFHPAQSTAMPSVMMTTQIPARITARRASSYAGVIYAKTPQLGIRNYASHLFGYPCGCAEQTSSKAMPWLLTDEELEPLKAKVAEGKPARDILKAAVMRLATMQKANGSFVMWDKHGPEQPWDQVYATDFLWRAEQRYPGLVPEQMLEKALKNVIRYPQKSELSSTRYYAAWVGTKARKINYTTLWALDQSARNKPLQSPLSAAYLGAALLLNGALERGEFYLKQVELIQRKSSDDASYNYADYDYGSLLRDYAQTVLVLSTLENSIKLSDDLMALRNRLASQLTRMLSEHSYLSTQEQVSVVEAGIALKALNQDPVDIVLNHGGGQDILHAKGWTCRDCPE